MTDITEPTSEHASLILRGLWPSASESAWREFAHECLALAAQLTGENDAQTYVATVLGESAGDLIDSLQKLLTTSTSTLAQRINCYRGASGSAEVIAAQIYAAKVEMTEAVDNAERLITAAREELKPKIEAAQAAGLAAVAGGYTAELLARTQAALASAQAEVATTSATAVASIETAAAALPSPAAMPSPHAGSTSPPATTPNAIPADYPGGPTADRAGHGQRRKRRRRDQVSAKSGGAQAAHRRQFRTYRNAHIRARRQRPQPDLRRWRAAIGTHRQQQRQRQSALEHGDARGNLPDRRPLRPLFRGLSGKQHRHGRQHRHTHARCAGGTAERTG